MEWKFWRKKPEVVAAPRNEAVKVKPKEKPRELPQLVYKHLVADQGFDADWVWNLKFVRQGRATPRSTFDIRIFNPGAAAQGGVKVTNYASLDDHMDLVIFAGWYDRELAIVELEQMIKEAV